MQIEMVVSVHQKLFVLKRLENLESHGRSRGELLQQEQVDRFLLRSGIPVDHVVIELGHETSVCTTAEVLEGQAWFPHLEDRGEVVARAITDGPDADYDKLRWTLLAALAEAQSSVQIVTPYFLPDPALTTALNLAALRGLRVDIILPGNSNLPFVDWASRAMWWQVLERGCRIWLTPAPFDHSKLMIVDGHWVLFGSANWDARSLRLNFELSVECYGRDFASTMETIVQQKLLRAREMTLVEADARPVLTRLRDATARLFSPYL